MKRDMELVRKILLKLEESTIHDRPVLMNIEGYKPEEVNYHIQLMWEAGLLKLFGQPVKTLSSPTRYYPNCLTWEGHEFLDASRNESVWKRTLRTIREKGSGLSFEIVKTLLIQYTKDEFNALTH